jgi:hypothetical protein
MNEGAGWFGILADGTEFDNMSPTKDGGTYFYASGSSNTITVVPEPVSLFLFMTAAAVVLRRRK